MAKFIKGNAGRKPPEPGATHDDVATWVQEQMPLIQPIVAAIDDLIRQIVPDPELAIKRGHVYYGLEELGWIIELAAYHKTANVLFLGGADFEAPPPLGEVDRTRYVKVGSLDDVAAPELAAWIRQAITIPGWR